MNDIQALNLAPLLGELRSLAHSADRGAFQPVPALLQRMLSCETLDLAQESDAAASWQAMRSVLDERTTITCWLDDPAVSLVGAFVGAVLESWLASTDRQQIAMIQTSHGALFTDGEGVQSGATAWMEAANIRKRMDEAMARWRETHPHSEASTCSACEFDNNREAAACALCGAPMQARSGDVHATDTPTPGRDAGPEVDRETRPGVSAVPAPEKIPIERAEEYSFSLTLMQIADGDGSAVAALVREMLQLPARSAHVAVSLTSNLPALLLSGVSMGEARSWAQRLEALEATVEIRRMER